MISLLAHDLWVNLEDATRNTDWDEVKELIHALYQGNWLVWTEPEQDNDSSTETGQRQGKKHPFEVFAGSLMNPVMKKLSLTVNMQEIIPTTSDSETSSDDGSTKKHRPVQYGVGSGKCMFGCPTENCGEQLSANAEVIRVHMCHVHKSLNPLPQGVR